jgi:hypothetical protein
MKQTEGTSQISLRYFSSAVRAASLFSRITARLFAAKRFLFLNETTDTCFLSDGSEIVPQRYRDIVI